LKPSLFLQLKTDEEKSSPLADAFKKVSFNISKDLPKKKKPKFKSASIGIRG
jgi:hypothetical protein